VINATLTNSTISFSWAAVPYANAYQVEMREYGAANYGGTTVTGTTYTQSVQANKAHEYRVRSGCNGTQSAWSNFATGTRTTAVCTPATNLTAVVIGNQAILSLTPHPYANANFFYVNRIGTATWGGTTFSGNSRTFTLQNGSYQWKTRSTCINTVNTGWSVFSPVSYFTVGPVAQKGMNSSTEPTDQEFIEELTYWNPDVQFEFETVEKAVTETPSSEQQETIFDMNGRRLSTPRSELPAGVYIIKGKQVGIIR
jgi:hypothetical protein